MLEAHKGELKSVKGLKGVTRTVCGGCQDYKVATAAAQPDFAAWADRGFPPEAAFLEAVKAIPGVSVVETQTFTVMPVEL